MKPLVSILVPAHNAEAWVAETLESALAQIWDPKEIIVVDDGSTDRTLEIARSFEARGVRVISQENKGASAARNRAWSESSGEWLQFLDADDLLDPRKIATQMERAEGLGKDYAYSAKWARFTRTVQDADFTPEPLCRDADPVDWIITKLRDDVMMHPAAWLVSRKLADAAGPWNATLTLDDDGEFFSRVVMASRGVRNCDAAISYYRSAIQGSLSGRKSPAAWLSAYRSLQLTAGRLTSLSPNPAGRAAAANAYMRLAFSAYPIQPEVVLECEKAASSLGGSHVYPAGGRLFRLVAHTFGWKAAIRIRRYNESKAEPIARN